MPIALIAGAGTGLSASLARKFAARGLQPVLFARNGGKLKALAEETGAIIVEGDAASPAHMEELFGQIDSLAEEIDVAVYNPSARQRGPIVDLDPEGVRKALEITAFGAFLMAQQAAKRMLKQGHGTILFTGASAGVKGYPQSASFAMGKFALRGLCQSLARELHPQGIHIGHIVIDGGIENEMRLERVSPADKPDSMLNPNAIADSYLYLMDQHRSCWSWEIEVRPFVERF